MDYKKKREILREYLEEQTVGKMSKKEIDFSFRLLEHQEAGHGGRFASLLERKPKLIRKNEIPRWVVEKSRKKINGNYAYLYHGKDTNLKPERYVKKIMYEGIPYSSWTEDLGSSKLFALDTRKNWGYVITAKVPRDKVLIHYEAFPVLKEHLDEQEVVVDRFFPSPRGTSIRCYYGPDFQEMKLKKTIKLNKFKQKDQDRSFTDGLMWR